MAIDIERVVAAAADSYLGRDDGDGGGGGSSRRDGRRGNGRRRRRLAGVGSLAVGVGLGLAGRAAYRRVSDIDLEQAAGALAERLQR